MITNRNNLNTLEKAGLTRDKLLLKTIYTKEPSGRIHVERDLKGRPPYGRIEISPIKKTKTIVLASSFFKHLWMRDDEHGFFSDYMGHNQLALWNGQNLELIPMTDKETALEVASHQATYGKKSQILKAAQKLKIASDDIEIIDDFRYEELRGWLTRLGEEFVSETLRGFQLKYLSETEVDNLLESLEKENIRNLDVDGIVLDKQLPRVQKFFEYLPHLDTLICRSSESELSQFLDQEDILKRIRRLVFNPYSDTSRVIDFLKSSFKYFVAVESIQITPTIGEFNTKALSFLPENIKVEFRMEGKYERFPRLQTDLVCCDIRTKSCSEFRNYLLSLPLTNTIEIYRNNLLGLSTLELPILENIENLKISNCQLSPTDLNALLGCFPNLIRIKLFIENNEWKNLTSNQLFKSMSNLRNITIIFSNIDGEWEQDSHLQFYLLSALWQHSKLVNIKIQGLKEQKALEVKFPVQSQLLKLHLDRCELMPATVNNIFTLAQSVQLLKLTDLEVLYDTGNLQSPPFLQLKSLIHQPSFMARSTPKSLIRLLANSIPSELCFFYFDTNSYDKDFEQLFRNIKARYKHVHQRSAPLPGVREYNSSGTSEESIGGSFDPDSRFSIDSNTELPPSVKLHRKFITKDPELNNPIYYIEKCFDGINITDTHIQLVSTWKKNSRSTYSCSSDPFLKESFHANSDTNLVYREFQISLTPNKPFRLTGIKRGDELIAFYSNVTVQISDLGKHGYSIMVPLGFGENANINVYFAYMLRTKKMEDFELDEKINSDYVKLFASMPFSKIMIKNKHWIQENSAILQAMQEDTSGTISALVTFINSFVPEKLTEEKYTNDFELFEAIKTQRKGLGKHKSWMFKIYMTALQSLNIAKNVQVDVIESSTHMWPVIEIPNKGIYKVIFIEHRTPKLEFEEFVPLPEGVLTFNKKLKPPPPVITPYLTEVKWEIMNGEKFLNSLSKRLTAGTDKDHCLAHATQALLFFHQESELVEFHRQALRWLRQNHQRYFYLDHFNDITEIEEVGDEGRPGKIFRFLDEAKSGDWLIVRWPASSRKRSDFTGFNSMMDAERKLMGRPIKDGIKLVVIMPKSEIRSLREDFFSRFSQRLGLIIPVSPGLFSKKRALSPEIKRSTTPTKITFSLDEDENWYDKLIGCSNITEIGRTIIPGFLINLINELKTKSPPPDIEIEIQNPPRAVSDPQKIDHVFQIFWQTLIETKDFEFDEVLYHIPESIELKLNDKAEYVYPLEICRVIPATECKSVDEILHSGIVQRYFAQAHEKNNRGIIGTGLFAKYQSRGCMNLLDTDEISPGTWVSLLKEAKRLNVKINLVETKSGLIPSTIKQGFASNAPYSLEPIPFEEKNFSETILKKSAVIVTSDPSMTLAVLRENHKDLEVVPIKYDMGNELIEYWEKVGHDDRPSKRRYILKVGVLLEKLRRGKTLVLHSPLSPELQGQLAGLLLGPELSYVHFNGQHEKVPGKVIILTKNKDEFEFVQPYQHSLEFAKYWLLAEKKYSKPEVDKLRVRCSEQHVKIKSFNQLCAMLFHQRHFPERDPLESWKLLDNVDLSPQWHALEYKEAVDEQKERLSDINRWLDISPYVFLMGPTSSGKSTLVQEFLADYLRTQGKRTRIWSDESDFEKWAATPKDKNTLHILFLDEANMAYPGEYDGLKGLYNNPPTIIYRGREFILTPQHKIIFAGNQNRENHEFFEEHGAIYPFPCFTLPYRLKAHVLPILEKNRPELKPYFSAILNQFKQIYEWVEKNPSTKRVITTRNLQVMAFLLAATYKTAVSEEQMITCAKQVALNVVENLLTKNDHAKLASQMGQHTFPEEKYSPPSIPRFVMMPDHLQMLKSFEREANIREIKIASQRPLRQEFVRLKKSLRALLTEGIVHALLLLVLLLKGKFKEYLNLRKGFVQLKRWPIAPLLTKEEFKEYLSQKKQLRQIYKQLCADARIGIRSSLVEGPSAIGKSTLIIEYLKANGFQNGFEKDVKTAGSKRFYHITPTRYELMANLLIKAFHEGAVVVIDELNSLPILEPLLNSLLMGKDLKNKPPKREGFYLFCTQNPADFPGRAILSEALQNRMHKSELPDYIPTQLFQIIKERFNLPDPVVNQLVEQFLIDKKNSTLPLTLRHLFDRSQDKIDLALEVSKDKLSAGIVSLAKLGFLQSKGDSKHIPGPEVTSRITPLG